MRPRFQTIRTIAAWWGRVRERVPLTGLGFAVAALSAGAYWGVGVPRVDYVMQLVGVLGLALVILALAVVVPGAWAVHRAFASRTATPESAVVFEARRGFATLLAMPTFRWIPVLEVGWSWTSPDGFTLELSRSAGELIESVESTQRQQTDEIIRRFVVEDPFGLARVVLRRTEARTVRVLPWVGRLGAAPMLRAHAGGEEMSHPAGLPEGDRIDMRRYVAGDPLRMVLWKVYARRRELMVRTPERAISPSLKIVAYLPAADGDEPAAGAARVAVESGLLGDGWIFGADGASTPASDPEGALDLIVASAAARGGDAGDAGGLDEFLTVHAELGQTRLILFVPATPGPWLETVVRAIGRRDIPVTAIVATDHVVDSIPQPGRWSRWTRLPAEVGAGEHPTTVEYLGEVASALRGAGAYVVGFERPTGRALHFEAAAVRKVA